MLWIGEDLPAWSGALWVPLHDREVLRGTTHLYLRFDGRVAIITGAGGGLGRSHALELARCGAHVLVNDLGGALDGSGSSMSAADRVVDEITAFGGSVVPNHDSVATSDGGQAIVQAALAGLTRVLSIEWASDDIKVNAIAPIASTRMTQDILGDLAVKVSPESVSPLVAYLVPEEC